MLIGIAVILLFLACYFEFNSPLYLFGITFGIMAIIFGFYAEDKKIKVSISYLVAALGVNIVQWLILVYIFYYIPFYVKLDFYIFLMGTLGITLFLVNQIRKKYLKSPENSGKPKIRMLKDKTKLIMLSVGVITIIGGLVGLITYYAPIFLYGITLGLMAFIYGYYHQDKKVNVSWNYAKAMGFLITLHGLYYYHGLP